MLLLLALAHNDQALLVGVVTILSNFIAFMKFELHTQRSKFRNTKVKIERIKSGWLKLIHDPIIKPTKDDWFEYPDSLDVSAFTS
jgi:hypothetical protein